LPWIKEFETGFLMAVFEVENYVIVTGIPDRGNPYFRTK
jgi:hypothetical protein